MLSVPKSTWKLLELHCCDQPLVGRIKSSMPSASTQDNQRSRSGPREGLVRVNKEDVICKA